MGSIAFVGDTTMWREWAPYTGSRYRIELEQSFPTLGSELSLTNAIFDARRYFGLGRRSTIALRLLLGGSFGADKSYFYLGGIDTLRGYNYEDLVGTRIGLLNLEVRIPLIDVLHFGWPVRWTIGGIRGIIFADLGGAWSDWQYGPENPFNIIVREENRIRLDDVKAAIGIGMRLRLGAVFCRLRRSTKYRPDPIGTRCQISLRARASILNIKLRKLKNMESRTKRFVITIVILGIVGGLGALWVNLYPDLLWFEMVDYKPVFMKILWTKILVGAIVGVCYLAILLINLAFIYRFTPAHLSPAFMGGTEFTDGAASDPGTTRKMVYGGLTLLAILFSILMGYTASDRWEIYLRFFNADELVFPLPPLFAWKALLTETKYLSRNWNFKKKK